MLAHDGCAPAHIFLKSNTLSNDGNIEYYTTRRRQARELADVASDPHVRRIHLDMVEHYTELLDELRMATLDVKPTAPIVE